MDEPPKQMQGYCTIEYASDLVERAYLKGLKQGMSDAAHELMLLKDLDRPTVYECHGAIIKARDAKGGYV